MEDDNKDVDCPENIVGENMDSSMSVFNLAIGQEICTSGQCDVLISIRTQNKSCLKN